MLLLTQPLGLTVHTVVKTVVKTVVNSKYSADLLLPQPAEAAIGPAGRAMQLSPVLLDVLDHYMSKYVEAIQRFVHS